MEAQLQRPVHGHHAEEEDPQNAGLHSGEDTDQQGEKKSVLKKVKDKAKKIRGTLKKHGHGYVGGPEEVEDDDEAVTDPEIHCAPNTVYESTVIRTINLPRQIDVNLENPSDTGEDRYDPFVKGAGSGKVAHAPEDAIQREEANSGEPMGLEDPRQPKNSPAEIPPSNYESKVTDPTGYGDKEADVDPLTRSFDNLNVLDEYQTKPESKQRTYTGSRDQFSLEPMKTEDQFTPVSDLKSFDSAKSEGMPCDTITGKISSAIADKAISAKNVFASNLGYGDSSQEGIDSNNKPESETKPGYVDKIVGTLTPVYEKVAGAGTAGMSKVQGSGGAEKEVGDTEPKGTDKGVSMMEYLVEKFRPGHEDKELSEVITGAINKKKEGVEKTGEDRPMGKVTELEEVATHLGSGGNESTGAVLKVE